MTLIDAIQMFDSANAYEVSQAARQWYYYRGEGGRHCGKLRPFILYFGENYPLHKITIVHLREWRRQLGDRHLLYGDHPQRGELKQSLSPYTLRNHVKAVKRFFNWCVTEELIPADPSQKLNFPPLPKQPPRDIQVADAWEIVRIARLLALRDMAFYHLRSSTPITQRDLLNLTVDDYDIATNLLTIRVIYRSGRVQNRVKKEKVFSLTLSEESAKSLNEYLTIRDELDPCGDDPALFVGREGAFREMYRGGLVYGVRNLAFIETLASTAARISGVAGLTLDRLNLAEGTAEVREKGGGGEGVSRIVFLDAEAVNSLTLWLQLRPKVECKEVFVNSDGQPLGIGGYHKILNGLADMAGIDGRYNPHSWRHAWAMQALRAGADLKTISDVLGHSDIKVTAAHYLRWHRPELQERHKRFSWKRGENDEK